jgi:hypothetical protein
MAIPGRIERSTGSNAWPGGPALGEYVSKFSADWPRRGGP